MAHHPDLDRSPAQRGAHRCGHCAAEGTLQRLREAAAALGNECLDSVWRGRDVPYTFRCAQGHEWTRRPPGFAPNARRALHCPTCAKASRARAQLEEQLDRFSRIAAERGGACLGASHFGSRLELNLRCERGHEWQTTGRMLLRGTWCGRCADEQRGLGRRRPDGLQALQEAAQAKGGSCVSTDYAGIRRRYQFRCANGHEWQTNGGAILSGFWCIRCAHDAKRLSLDDARQWAIARGGACLSQTYVNVSARMLWQCHRDHVWPAKFGNIRNGKWCPECAHMAQITNPKSKAWLRHGVSTRHRLIDGSDESHLQASTAPAKL